MHFPAWQRCHNISSNVLLNCVSLQKMQRYSSLTTGLEMPGAVGGFAFSRSPLVCTSLREWQQLWETSNGKRAEFLQKSWPWSHFLCQISHAWCWHPFPRAGSKGKSLLENEQMSASQGRAPKRSSTVREEEIDQAAWNIFIPCFNVFWRPLDVLE